MTTRPYIFLAFFAFSFGTAFAKDILPILSDTQKIGVSAFEAKWYGKHLAVMKEPSIYFTASTSEQY